MIQRTQFSEFGAPVAPPVAVAAPTRRLRAFPRSSVPLAVKWFPSPSGNEWIAVITSGVNLVVDGVDPSGPLDISADRLVIWTRGQAQPDLAGNAAQAPDVPLELYMEGNVIFRQGQRVVEAANMFYDVRLAFYRNGIETLTGERPQVMVVGIQSQPGHEVFPLDFTQLMDELDSEARMRRAVEDLVDFDIDQYLDRPIKVATAPLWLVRKISAAASEVSV
jgi:hypothetical protein